MSGFIGLLKTFPLLNYIVQLIQFKMVVLASVHNRILNLSLD